MNSPSSVEGTTQTDLFRLPGGESVMVRAISPQDADRLQAYMRNLSGPTRRNRFLGAVSLTWAGPANWRSLPSAAWAARRR